LPSSNFGSTPKHEYEKIKIASQRVEQNYRTFKSLTLDAFYDGTAISNKNFHLFQTI
jgi:hypothetical protein